MATSTISNTIKDASGVAVSGVTVVARLKPGPAFRISDASEVAGQVTTTSNGSGAWTLALEQTANITPANSWWEIEEQIPDASGGRRTWAVTVGAGTAALAASLTTPPAALPVGGMTQATGDSRYLRAGLILNVKADFGALGDGVTDDTAAIQAALNTCPATGGAVWFPPGVYKTTDTLIVPYSAALIGSRAGRDSSQTNVSIKYAGPSGRTVLNAQNTDHVLVHGVRLDGNSLAGTGIAFGFTTGTTHVAFARLEDVTIQDVTGTAVDTGAGHPGGACNDCKFVDVIIERCGLGYDFYSTNNVIEGGVVAGCTTTGGMRFNDTSSATVDTVVFSGNLVDLVGAGDTFIQGIVCNNCWFETSTTGIFQRTHVPTIAAYVGRLHFIGCQLSSSSAAHLFDFTNTAGIFIIEGCRVDPAAGSLAVTTPAGVTVYEIATDLPLSYSGSGTPIIMRDTVGMPGNTRRGLAKVYNSATGDAYGLEQVSSSQTGDGEAALRVFTSFSGAHLAWGKYTSASAFTEWARIRSDGAFVLGAQNSASTCPGHWSGTGAPSNAVGQDGDFYWRKDPGAAGTHIYQKGAGAWTGLV